MAIGKIILSPTSFWQYPFPSISGFTKFTALENGPEHPWASALKGPEVERSRPALLHETLDEAWSLWKENKKTTIDINWEANRQIACILYYIYIVLICCFCFFAFGFCLNGIFKTISWGFCCLSSVTCVRSDASANVLQLKPQENSYLSKDKRLPWLPTGPPDVCPQLPVPPESMSWVLHWKTGLSRFFNGGSRILWFQGHSKGLTDISGSPQPSGGRVKFIWTKQLMDEHQRHLKSI